MKHALGRSALALALLAGVSTGISAQTAPAAPIHRHRETTPAPSTVAADASARLKVHFREMNAARAPGLFYRGHAPANAGNVKAMVPNHARLISALLNQYDAEMVGRTPDALHEASEQAVRQDLARLPELRRGDIDAFLPRHSARVSRFVRVHQASLSN
jgi:hypothetical protein